jgi:hypothetical protein
VCLSAATARTINSSSDDLTGGQPLEWKGVNNVVFALDCVLYLTVIALSLREVSRVIGITGYLYTGKPL